MAGLDPAIHADRRKSSKHVRAVWMDGSEAGHDMAVLFFN
jgi:hypothetical protein